MQSAPSDILKEIFARLRIKHLRSLRLISRRWRDAIDDQLVMFTIFDETSLCIDRPRIALDCMITLPSLPSECNASLESLELGLGGHLHPVEIDVSRFRSLRHLSILAGPWDVDIDLSHLTVLRSLRLMCMGHRLSNRTVRTIPVTIEEITLDNFSTDLDAWDGFHRLRNLRELRIWQCCSFRMSDLPPKLEVVNFVITIY